MPRPFSSSWCKWLCCLDKAVPKSQGKQSQRQCGRSGRRCLSASVEKKKIHIPFSSSHHRSHTTHCTHNLRNICIIRDNTDSTQFCHHSVVSNCTHCQSQFLLVRLKKNPDKADDCKRLWIKIPPDISIHLLSGSLKRNASLPLALAHKLLDKFPVPKYPEINTAFQFNCLKDILVPSILYLSSVIVTIFNWSMKP